jgi:Peptidase family M28
MIDLRIWRIALLAVPVVITIAMFSLREAPQEISPGIPPDAFDPTTAAPLAKELAEKAPDPRPGSEADQLLADQVEDRFTSIPGAAIAEQRFEGSFRGDEVELRNLIATLPGESERQIAVLAPRDAADGSGALTSIASTAALLEIANGFSGSVHNKTLVFVSTDGSSIGALGARRFVRDYSDADRLDAAIVLSQPAAPQPRPHLVIPWSTGDESTSSQLADTANSTVSKETDTPAGDEGPLDDLFRLALPAGLGEQGPLVEAGLPAVRLSSDGELPIDPAEDDVENFGTDTFDRFGRATLALILSLDSSSEPIEHGPRGYIGIAGNLLPGWTIGLLALSLLVPVALAAGVGLASAARSPIEAARGAIWTALRSLPFLGALVVLSFGVVIGLVPSPEFPFDPRAEGLGLVGGISVAVVALCYAVIAFLLRPLRPPPRGATSSAAPAALLVACLAAFGIWLINPYLGLLVAIGLQAWLAAAARLAGGQPAAAGLVLVGLLPLAALLADLAGRFDAGLSVWQDLVLMFADGQIGFALVLIGCVLAGAGVAIVAVAGNRPTPSEPGFRGSTPREPEPEPEPGEPEGAISVRRQPRDSEPEVEPTEPPGEPQPAEPERDPRLWSKPRGAISPPPGSRSATPWPSVT